MITYKTKLYSLWNIMQNVMLTNSACFSHISYQQQTLLLCNVKGVFCLQFSTFYFSAYLTHLNKYQPNKPKSI